MKRLRGKNDLDEVTKDFSGLKTKDRMPPADSTLSQQWESIKTRTRTREKKEVRYLYHATSSSISKRIQSAGKLECNYDNGKDSEFTLSSNKEIKGVWFGATLYKGQLPTISPYGDRRIQFPVAMIITEKHEMFFESVHYYAASPKNQYMRFVLVKTDQTKEQLWCSNKLEKVNLADNPIFTFDLAHSYAECVENKYAEDKVHIWVEILVVGDVPFPIWTSVTKTNPAASKAIRSILPLL